MQIPRIKHIASRSKDFVARNHGKSYSKKIKSFLGVWKSHFFIRLLGIFLLLIAFGIFILWGIFLRWAPAIETLASGDYFRESTTIYDKDGWVIYTLFKDGKRTYITYDNISQSLKDAIVSTEDRTFFENPWIDMMGLVRAGAKYIIGSNDNIQGTSTISQQLIKNTILTNERSLKRKLQEMYLSYNLNNTYSKEKILWTYV
mgnify:FL=1